MNDKKNRLTEIMASAVEETLETMAFLEACEVEAPDALPDKWDLLRVSLLVHDPFPGEMCHVPCGTEITVNRDGKNTLQFRG
ncbi:MAG: hypothetical protein GWP10_19370 [Nitrospiraceae bacterium]|nr:hypothetical protein [Nitrospiraceae bacterium]